jgi:hypothetical protein
MKFADGEYIDIWDSFCEVPYCFLAEDCSSHTLKECPLMRIVIAVYGDYSKDMRPLATGMRCLACRCQRANIREHDCTMYYCEDESLHVEERCVHCLSICYCSQRTFEEVELNDEKGGSRYVKVEHVEEEMFDQMKELDMSGVKENEME